MQRRNNIPAPPVVIYFVVKEQMGQPLTDRPFSTFLFLKFSPKSSLKLSSLLEVWHKVKLTINPIKQTLIIVMYFQLERRAELRP
jgi:hypothetical protein